MKQFQNVNNELGKLNIEVNSDKTNDIVLLFQKGKKKLSLQFTIKS